MKKKKVVYNLYEGKERERERV